MNRVRAVTAAVVAALALAPVLAGCQPSGGASSPASTPASASASASVSASGSAGFSVPGTHKSAATYRIAAAVSTVVVTGHTGDVTVTGDAGTTVAVAQAMDYSSTAPVTRRTLSGHTLTISYSCATQVVCGVAYVVQVPRGVTVRATDGAGAIRLSGLTGNVTADTRTGLISATGLGAGTVSLTTDVGGITATFAEPPARLTAAVRVGAITLRVPGGTSYRVSADAHAGHASISVPNAASSGHVISATTDVGAISIATS